MALIGGIDITRALGAAARNGRGTQTKARQEALAMVEEEALALPSYSYRILPVREARGALFDLGGRTLHAPGLADVSAKLTGVAALACTLGPALEARVSELWAMGKRSLALALDDLGNELLMHTARVASIRIRGKARREGLSSGATLIPGGSGVALDQQEAVLALAQGERIGIAVAGEGLLIPTKSRSMLLGIGTGLSAQPHRKRCATCSSGGRCRYRAR